MAGGAEADEGVGVGGGVNFFSLVRDAMASVPQALAPAAGPKREGAVETEGLAGVFAAGDWHRAGYTGRGVDIAVLDVGFLGAEALAGTELPRRLHLSGPGDDTSAHGTAVAEIIHDIAPDARLHLRRFRTDAELVAATEALSADGVQVLNASVGFDNLWPSDGTSPWSVAARDAVESNLPRLRELLEGSGLNLLDVNVAQQQQRGPRSDRDARESGNPNARNRLSGIGQVGEAPAPARRSLGLVDDYA